mmetsp:Transcript_13931/g.6904  ORF Transcript_13931/g.6904 Transcript_13931/m.6904 type:complete len:91 (+) Transcript_13931:76-348(+)
MKRGTQGLAGGGIYFAETPEATCHKAEHHGVVIKCQILLGNILTIGKHGDTSITFTKLYNRGYDSVLIPRIAGNEYVVYNWDQVQYIEEI